SSTFMYINREYGKKRSHVRSCGNRFVPQIQAVNLPPYCSSSANHINGNVDFMPAVDVPADSLTKYSAVLVGSVIHAGHWISPARHFIHRERAAFADRPVWAFSVGAPPNLDDKDAEEASESNAQKHSGAKRTQAVHGTHGAGPPA